MDANKRLVLTIAISFAILFGFQYFFGGMGAPPPVDETPAPEAPVPAPEAREGGEGQPGLAEERAPAAPRPPERKATLSTEAFELTFSSHGAGIEKAELRGAKGRRQGKDAPQVDLAQGLLPTDPLLFELHGRDGLPAFGPRAACALTESGELAVAFRCEDGGLVIEKRFSLEGESKLFLEATLRNASGRAMEGVLDLVVPARLEVEQQGGGGCAGLGGGPPSRTQAVCGDGEELYTQAYDKKKPVERPAGGAAFVGIDERYFLAVAVPIVAGQRSSCELVGAEPDFLSSHLLSPTGRLAPGGSASFRWELVIGPKGLHHLQDLSTEIAASQKIANPHLEETVDLGFWAAIARILLWLLRLFHGIIPNWGVAIILLTLLVKVATLPLTWKSMKSMEGVRLLAPEIEKLKQKYGEDREKLNQEMMALYQRHKVNPLGGCLPMLIQMPIWLALYTTLLTSVELYNEPFIGGWINDLTSKDPFYILPLAMGATMFVAQKLQPMQGDPAQQKMLLYFMPIFFTFIMLQLPAGLTLYIFTNNILSIGQQLVLRKAMGSAPAQPAAARTVDTRAKGRKEKR